MERIAGFCKRHVFFLTMAALAFLCWGRLLFLRGIWVDDWAWIWHYFSCGSLSEFLGPLKSLRHPLDGLLFFANFKLLDIIPGQAAHVWNVWKFIFFFLNPFLLYFIVKDLTGGLSVLPETIAALYLVSPVVSNLCTVELGRRVYMSFFLLSILLSIRSVGKEGISLTRYLPALFLSLVSICGIESFFFFELVRPAVIFYMLRRNRGGSFLKNAGGAALYWMPFFTIGLFILAFNMGFIRPRSGIYADVYDLYNISIWKYAIIIVKRYLVSFFRLSVSGIYLFLNQGFFLAKHVFMLLTAILSALFAVYSLNGACLAGTGCRDASGGLVEARRWVIIGALLTILGLFPYIVVRGPMVFGIGSRHALLASLGFSVFTASVFLWLYYSSRIGRAMYYILFGSVIFLGVFNCNAIVKSYDDDWRQQRSFWSQFVERVPDIKDRTYLVIEMPRHESVFLGNWRATFEFSAPLNLLYATSTDKDELNRHFAETLENALSADVEWSYVNNKDKAEGQYESYKGTQKFYPKNLMMASYFNGRVYLNDEAGRTGISPAAGEIIEHSLPGLVMDGKKARRYPMRWIMQ